MNTNDADKQTVEALTEELREGSETRYMGTRTTPDGKETVEMIPLEWAIEVIMSKQSKLNQLLIKERLSELDLLPQSEIGKLANHSLAVDLHVTDRKAFLENQLGEKS